MKVYGEHFDEAMRNRMIRDQIASVRRAVVDRGQYGQRGYIERVSDNSVNFYHMRRDGRVARSWTPINISKVIETGDEVTL